MRKYSFYRCIKQSFFYINRIRVIGIITLILPSQILVSDATLTQILGQYGLISSEFCLFFNECTINYFKGILIPTFIFVFFNKKFDIFFGFPNFSTIIKNHLSFESCSGVISNFRNYNFFLNNKNYSFYWRQRRLFYKNRKGVIHIKNIFLFFEYKNIMFDYIEDYYLLNTKKLIKSALGTLHSMGILIIFFKKKNVKRKS